MNLIKQIRLEWAVISILFVLTIGHSVKAQEKVDSAGINFRYKQHYYFVTMPDTVYTFQSEFVLPEGYRHADSSELSDFQNYVANFPLWHRYLPVGNWKNSKEYEHTEISRPVHLPHAGTAMTDRAVPIRILAEYFHDRGREFDLNIIPNSGDTMMYSKWLFNDITYGPRRTVMFKPVPPKDTTLKQYYTFMRFCMENTTYQSLAFNSDSVASKNLMPGDLFVAHNENGTKGVTFVILHMLMNDRNEKLYAVATGCEKACDFHIPIFNNDRNNPWITSEQIKALGKDYPKSGFLRLKVR